jgi:hypothetical protein
MAHAKRSDTIVIQTFRRHDIPAWIQRCLDSVAGWARRHGHDHVLAGDEFYALCGPDYLARGNKNPRAITNLARLVATRQYLDAGYRNVIWMDADVFVFDPDRLVFDFMPEQLGTGYAFGREVWVRDLGGGQFQVSTPMVHNAAMFFTREAVDLDMLITLIRHIDAHREGVSNFHVGVRLLRGLQYSLMFPTFSHVALFSPMLTRGLVEDRHDLLRRYGETYAYPVAAANLCLSVQERVTEELIWQAMDRLEKSGGEAINVHATHAGVHLIPAAQ